METTEDQKFERAAAMLDATGRPYILIMLDTEVKAGELIEPGNVQTFWRSTISRGATIMALGHLAALLTARPELLEDV